MRAFHSLFCLFVFIANGCLSISTPSDNSTVAVSAPTPKDFYDDCESAIHQLPNDDRPVQAWQRFEFKNTHREGRYSLPKEQKYGICRASIFFKTSFVSDDSSWEDIKRKLRRMNTVCIRDQCQSTKDHAGVLAGIVLWLRPTKRQLENGIRPVEGAANLTLHNDDNEIPTS